MSSSQVAENYQLKWHSHLTNLNSAVATLYRYAFIIICKREYDYRINSLCTYSLEIKYKTERKSRNQIYIVSFRFDLILEMINSLTYCYSQVTQMEVVEFLLIK